MSCCFLADDIGCLCVYNRFKKSFVPTSIRLLNKQYFFFILHFFMCLCKVYGLLCFWSVYVNVGTRVQDKFTIKCIELN